MDNDGSGQSPLSLFFMTPNKWSRRAFGFNRCGRSASGSASFRVAVKGSAGS